MCDECESVEVRRDTPANSCSEKKESARNNVNDTVIDIALLIYAVSVAISSYVGDESSTTCVGLLLIAVILNGGIKRVKR